MIIGYQDVLKRKIILGQIPGGEREMDQSHPQIIIMLVDHHQQCLEFVGVFLLFQIMVIIHQEIVEETVPQINPTKMKI